MQITVGVAATMAQCFVIQPFDKGQYDKRYTDILKPAIIAAGLVAYRVDEDPNVIVPIDDIERNIRDSDICLADISTNNPNVWYEVGFAMAHAVPIIMICGEPRQEPFPFDIRHRLVISYATQSSSDFEKLKKQLTERLKAQTNKTKKIQTAAAMSQIKPTEGLLPHEVSVLLAIMSLVYNPEDGVMPYRIKEYMEKTGYTSIASTLSLASLKRKEMVEFFDKEGEAGEVYSVCRVSQKGLEWLLSNQDQFEMKYPRITDEDIPF